MWERGRRRGLLLALPLITMLHAVAGQTSQNAQVVQAACPLSNYCGEDFYLGATLLNNTITTLAGCCQLCGGTPFCAWTWCPATADSGCTAPLGPVANTTFPAGTCLASLFLSSDNTTKLTWSRMQDGNPWVSGSTSDSPQYIDSADSYSDDRETIGSLQDKFFCRKISGGTLKLSPLRAGDGAGLDVTDGQEVQYTGIQLVDSAGQKWSVIFQNASSSSYSTSGDGIPLWQYPSDQLAFCDAPTPGCSPNAFGQSTEEGAACESSSNCGVCGGSALACLPRGTTDMQIINSGIKVSAQAPTFPLTGGDPWDAAPNECRQQLNISAPLGPLAAWYPSLWSVSKLQNGSATCSDFSLAAYADGNTATDFWSYNAGNWEASGPPKLKVDTGEVDSYIQQLCSNTATANATLARAVLSGGADAQKAFLAMYKGGSQTVCPDGSQTQLFVDYITARGASNAASVRNYASQFVEAAGSAGFGACVDIVAVSLDSSSVLEQYRIHNPSPSASPPPSPPPSSPGPSPSPGLPPAPSGPDMLPNGTLRLAGSHSCTQGRAEVAMAGSWGAVCSAADGGDAGHQRNAQVICRGQGLPSEQPTVSAATAPAGTAVWIKELNCTGSERSVMECPHTAADGSSAGSEDCLALSVTCADAASADSAAAAMCSQRPGRCQTLPGSCDPPQGYCSFAAQPAGTPCLGGVCNERGECALQDS
ncbi:hypothetical protein ABPG75_005685 [Micractinium tetrahymenae]